MGWKNNLPGTTKLPSWDVRDQSGADLREQKASKIRLVAHSVPKTGANGGI